jgi:transglutaminase-like putative cysteine protease
MHYRITHRTSYLHSETVPLCQNALWMTPRSDRRQRCTSSTITIHPEPSSRSERIDYFGNGVTYFSISTGYKSLDVEAVSDVIAEPPLPQDERSPAPAWEDVIGELETDLAPGVIDAVQFRFDSPSIATSDELAAYARQSFLPGRPIDEAARELIGRIHAEFQYDPGATTVQTSVAEAFAMQRGVCQDFAHVAIACLRSIGLSARYVSGYLRTLPPPGQPRLIGADASHAWLGVYCGPAGWIDFDPTNDVVPATDHVTIAWGRDYGDVTPVRGLFIGGGNHEMTVSVDVAPVDDNV